MHRVEMDGGRIVLYRADSLDVLPTLCREDIQAVVTDPPYGMANKLNSKRFSGGQSVKINRKSGDGRNNWPAVVGDDQPFDPSPWLAFLRVVLWGSNHYAQRLPIGTTLVWVKKGQHMFGSFLSDAEIGWMKTGCGVYCFQERFQPHNRIHEGSGKVVHPNQKPIRLMEWCLDMAKVPKDGLVFDPYMGSGTTGVACARTGRRFIGCEIDPTYFAAAVRRLEKAGTDGPLFAQVGEQEELIP